MLEQPLPLRAAALYQRALELAFAGLPAAAIYYVYTFQSQAPLFVDFGFHVAAITVAVTLVAFAASITCICYGATGDSFQRYLALALVAFGVIYAPHGFLTHHAASNPALFLLYGPVSRLAMDIYLLLAVLSFHAPRRRPEPRSLVPHFVGMVALLPLVAWLAHQGPVVVTAIRIGGESLSLVAALAAVAVMIHRRIEGPLLWLAKISLLFSAQASVAFLLAKPWNHLWWLAHVISAGGFLLLNYGIVRAYATTKSFTSFYSTEEMIARLAASEAEARASENSAQRLRRVLDTSPVAAVVTSEGGKMLYSNGPARTLFGSAVEGVTRDWTELAEGTEIGLKLTDAQGRERCLQVSSAALDFADEPARVVWSYDVTDLTQAVDAANAASRSKTLFLSNMSHELRTPLNAIIGFSDGMLHGMGGTLSADHAGYVHDVKQSGEHLLGVINDILDVSRIELGAFELNPEKLDLVELLRLCLRQVEERALSKGVRLSSHFPDEPVQLRADARALRQSVLSLLSNAIKFTPANGRVDLSVAVDGDAVMVAVGDTGPGIPPEQLERMFQPFQQLADTHTRTHEGVGLGLSLVRSFTEAQGGRVEASSRMGEGMIVTLRFPQAV